MIAVDSQADDEHAAEAVRKLMVQCLAELDRLKLHIAGAHLDMAIHALGAVNSEISDQIDVLSPVSTSVCRSHGRTGGPPKH